MTTLTERVPLDRIEHRARHARPGRAVLAAIALVLFAVGWLAFKLCAVTVTVLAAVWHALVWCGSAVVEGWQTAKTGQEAP